MSSITCEGITTKDKPCRNRAMKGMKTCRFHSHEVYSHEVYSHVVHIHKVETPKKKFEDCVKERKNAISSALYDVLPAVLEQFVFELELDLNKINTGCFAND